MTGLVLGVGAVIGMTAALVFARASSPVSNVRIEAAAVQRSTLPLSVEKQTATRRLSVFTSEPIDLLGRPGAVTGGFVQVMTFSPPYGAIDSILFDVGNVRVKLAGVWPVGRNEVCTDAAGFRFACGLMGRAALQNALAGKTVTCRRRFLPERLQRDGIVADCAIDGVDLAGSMVAAGLAFPSDGADSGAGKFVEEAHQKRRGVWAGPYDPPVDDRAFEDAAAVRIGSTIFGERGDLVPLPASVAPHTGASISTSSTKVGRAIEPIPDATTAAGTTRSVPSMNRLAPRATEGVVHGMVAGPILSAPAGLAEKLSAP